MPVPRWYRRIFALFPDAFRREAEPELLEMAAAEWEATADRSRWPRRLTAARLVVDQLMTLARAWTAWALGRRPGRSSPLDAFWQDVRYAWRGLARAPAFLAVAVGVIGIGVGATTTIVTVANGLLLRTPAGIVAPEELITVHARGQDGSSFHSFSYPDFRDLQLEAAGVDLAAYAMFPASVVIGAEPQFTGGFGVSGRYFPLLGVRPALGRLLGPADDQGGAAVVVLGHGFWRTRFGADSTIIGRAITLNGQPVTVVGVAEPGFRGHIAAFAAALWVPIGMSRGPNQAAFFTDRGVSFLEILGRGPGLSPVQAEARLSPVSARLGRARGLDWDRAVDVRRYSAVPAAVLAPVMGFLGLLIVLGGAVLLIASTNIAGVTMARAMARTRETAIRLAIGAGRGRLIRHLVVESLILFLGGGLIGIAIAGAATAALARIELPIPVPIQLEFPLDLRVLAISLGSALAVGLLCGLFPALQATAPGLASALKDDGSVRGSGRTRLRSVLVTAQVAASALLIVTAGLFVRTLGKASHVDIGFEPAGVHVAAVELEVLHYDQARTLRLAEQVETRLRAVAGVQAAGTIDLTPLSSGNQGSVVAVDGRESREGVGFFPTDFALVSPGYFEMLGIPIVRGRGFTRDDRSGAPRVMIVNRTLADRIWPGEDPVGKTLNWGQIQGGPPTVVVGVARNAKYRTLSEAPVPMLYLPIAQDTPERALSFLVKSSAPIAGIESIMRAAIREADPNLPLSTNVPLETLIGVGLLPNRVAAGLASAFGLVGLALASVGLYGVLSYLVVRRRRELGIRMALGASAGQVRRIVLREGLRLTAIGLVIGTGTALGLARLIRSFLFGFDSVDGIGVAIAVGTMAAVAVLASDLPARRAAATDPVEVLRHD